MSIPLNINGTDYFYPETGDVSWGPDATDWAVAVTSGMLQKAGGLFQLLGEVDFGANYGLKSAYYKTRTANPASAGSLRLARTDIISWRNQANDNNLSLSVSSSNELMFNGIPIQGAASAAETDSIDLDLAGGVISANLKVSSSSVIAPMFKVELSVEADGLLAQFDPFLANPSFTGKLEILTPVVAPAIINLPNDITFASPLEYTVGQNKIEVYLNGLLQLLNEDFAEVGSVGTTSSQIQILENLYGDDLLVFRIK